MRGLVHVSRLVVVILGVGIAHSALSSVSVNRTGGPSRRAFGGDARRRESKKKQTQKKSGPLFAEESWQFAEDLCDKSPGSRDPMLVFVHIFKCAGTTTRATLGAWSKTYGHGGCQFASAGQCRRRLAGDSGAYGLGLDSDSSSWADAVSFGAFVEALGSGGAFGSPEARRLRGRSSKSKLCTRDGRPTNIDEEIDVIAGHVWYSTIATSRPTIYVTCLREPLTLKVSATLYLHAKKYARMSFDSVVDDVAQRLSKTYRSKPYYDNTLKRLGSGGKTSLFGRNKKVTEDLAAEAARRAVDALDKHFAVVGLTEEYVLFYALLAKLLPDVGPEFWKRELARRENEGKHKTSEVKARCVKNHPDAITAVNKTLVYEWQVYDAAVDIHDARCKAHLGDDVCAGRVLPFAFLRQSR